MSTPPLAKRRPPPAVILGLVVGWLVILVKCMMTPWAVDHWHVPIHPAWIIVPTFVFAALVTMLIVTHDWKQDAED